MCERGGPPAGLLPATLLLAAGKPAAVPAFAHISPLRAVRDHLEELRVAQAIATSAGQAFILDEGRLVRFGFSGLDDEPLLSRLGWPLAGLSLAAVAMGEQANGDFPGRRKRRIWSCHK